MKSSKLQRVCRQWRGRTGKGGNSCYSRREENQRLEEECCFAHQTIENRSKEEPKGFVRADRSYGRKWGKFHTSEHF